MCVFCVRRYDINTILLYSCVAFPPNRMNIFAILIVDPILERHPCPTPIFLTMSDSTLWRQQHKESSSYLRFANTNKVRHLMNYPGKWKAFSLNNKCTENITLDSSAKKAYVILQVKMRSYKESGKGGPRRQNQELAGPTKFGHSGLELKKGKRPRQW